MTFLSTKLFGYSISKDYDGSLVWDYEILATNESLYSKNADGEKVFSHTLLIRDSKSKINYVIYCETENDTLKTYYEYINKYQTIKDIKEKLLPELQSKVNGYSSSDSGTWMFCYVNEYIDSYYSDIPDSTFEKLFYEKYDSGIFTGEELLQRAYELFDEEGEFWQTIFGSDEKFETEEDMYKYIINYILEEYTTEENQEKVDKLKTELMELIKESSSEEK